MEQMPTTHGAEVKAMSTLDAALRCPGLVRCHAYYLLILPILF